MGDHLGHDVPGHLVPGHAHPRASRSARKDRSSGRSRTPSSAAGLPFYIVQFFTSAILILAANTAYQDFPRLSSILARDRFMPRQFANRGDRLVFSNGVIVLGSLAMPADHRVRSRPEPADPALRRRRVHGVHAVADRHDPALAEGEAQGRRRRRRDGAARSSSTRSAPCPRSSCSASSRSRSSSTAHGSCSWRFRSSCSRSCRSIVTTRRSMAQLRRDTVRPGDLGANHVVLLVRDLDPPTAEALGYLRSFRPVEVHAVYPVTGDAVPPEVQDRWRTFAGGGLDLEPLACRGDDLLGAMRTYLKGIERAAVGLRHRAHPRGDQGRSAHVPAAEPQARPAEGRTAPRAERGRHRTSPSSWRRGRRSASTRDR